MPTFTRRELDNPAAVLTLVGAYDTIRWAYLWGRARPHVLGPPGPRGGPKTLCGSRVPQHWEERRVSLPFPPPPGLNPHGYWQYDPHQNERNVWAKLCTDCRTALGGLGANP